MFRPKIVFRDIYSPETTFSSYLAAGSGRWLPKGPAMRAWFSAVPLMVAGDIPVIVHESVVHPLALGLLRTLSLSFAENRQVVSSEKEYRSALRTIKKQGLRFHTDYNLPRGWLSAVSHAVDPDLCGSLNNKAMLERWVPEGFYPSRRSLSLRELKRQDPFDFPYVVKAATSFGSGGGVDVMVCHSRDDKEKALAYFEGEKRLLAEEWIADARLFCVQGAILKDGSYAALGSAEQLCDDKGRPRGNWVDRDGNIGREGEALAERVIRKAGEAGYRGFAGLDLLKTEKGGLKVIDLNFRTCHSTKGLLLREELEQKWNWKSTAIRSLSCQGDVAALLRIVAEGVGERRLLPWSIQIINGKLRLALLVGGVTREEASRRFLGLSAKLGA